MLVHAEVTTLNAWCAGRLSQGSVFSLAGISGTCVACARAFLTGHCEPCPLCRTPVTE